MSSDDRKPSLTQTQIQRIQERIRLAESSSGLARLQGQVAEFARPALVPEQEVAHIDVAKLQEAGIPTPYGGRSRVLDEYRLIKRSILRIAAARETPDQRLNLVMVTSAQPGEGKTFNALSLAMSVIAEKDVPVLLVDLDVVKQDTSRRLGINREIGIVDLLADSKLTLGQVLVPTNIPRLTVLPAGSDHPLAHELMAGPKMHELLDRISNMYRDGLVILDLAPVLVSADASVLAASVGQIVVVVEANRTARASVEQTLSLLQGCKRIALILNKVEASDLVEQYGSYYGEYYVRPDTLAKPSGPQSLADRLISYLRNRLHATKSK